MDAPDVEKNATCEENNSLSRNRSFKTKQLVRSQALRECQSPPPAPLAASPAPASSPSPAPAPADARDDVTDQLSEAGEGGEECRRQPVEIQITAGTWDDQPPSDQRTRTRRWLGNGRQSSRDLLSYNPRVACVCGACNACPHCRGRRRKQLCPTKQDSGIVCSDECPDCSDTEPSGGSNSESARKGGSIDMDEQTYCKCPERKDKQRRMEFSLSRTDSEEPTGIELVNFIKDTLNKNARDRVTLLKIEKELHSLINDTGRCIVRFPVMTSYGRMLVHRCAALFQLSHHLDQVNKTCVVVSKSGTSGGRIPCTSFKQWCTAAFPPSSPQRHHGDATRAKSILKRATQSLEEPGAGSLTAGRSKSLEQREREYERVRRRIFTEDSASNSAEDGQWQWLGAGPVKLLTTDTRNKLLKVQSLEVAGGGAGGRGARGAVSKSHSFGGYTPDAHAHVPRVLSRQGDLASSSWRLSPSSSGYRTLSLHSTDSVTPSPTGGASPEPNVAVSSAAGTTAATTDTGVEGVAVMWCVTDFTAVPPGAVLVHPQTGRPLTNPDGSVYRFDPARPPPLAPAPAPAPAPAGPDAGAHAQIDVSNEKKRGKLEKQHSFMDNECECQPSEECVNKCCCDTRRHDSDHSDKVQIQEEQKPQPPPSPNKNRYNQPTETTNHKPPPDPTTNQRAYDAPTNQKTPETTNHRPFEKQNYNNHKPYEMRFENPRPPSFEPANQRVASEPPNHRAMKVTNHGTPDIHYVAQQYQSGYTHEEVVSPLACAPDAAPAHGKAMPPPAHAHAHAHDNNMRGVPIGVMYGTMGPYYNSPPPASTDTFTIDPSYPYQPVDYLSSCGAVGGVGGAGAVGACGGCEPPPAPPRYALYAPTDHILHYTHYPYQESWAPLVPPAPAPAPAAPAPAPAHKLFVPELYPLVQPIHYPVYPQYNVLYPQMIPQAYPVYQTAPAQPARHHRRTSHTGSARNTPLTATPEEKKVPYEDHTIISSQTQTILLPHQNLPCQTQNLPCQMQNLPCQMQNLPCQIQNIPNQTQNLQTHSHAVQNHSLSRNHHQPMMNQVRQSHSQHLHSQTQNLPYQNQNLPNSSQNLPSNTSVPTQINSSQDQSNDLAAKINQINSQMCELSTSDRERSGGGGAGGERGAHRRDEWRRRNSGGGILGSYPAGGAPRAGVGAAVGAGAAAAGAGGGSLTPAARAIVNSLRHNTNNHYMDRRAEYTGGDRDKERHRRDDRRLPVYNPPYLLRQMSTGAWCRRSPAPIHPVLNPRRPHPDAQTRGGRR